MTESSFQNLVKGKNVVYITVKNRDYIRVSQIERILGKSAASYKVYASEKGNPLTRALDLRRRVKEIDLAATDVVIVGFLPQLIWKDIMKVARGQMRGAGGEDKSFEKKAPYLVADFFLSLYDTVVLDRKLIRTTNPLTGILRRMDKRVLAGADLVMTDTKANADFLAKEYDINPDKFETLYLEADKRIYDAKFFSPERKKAGVKESEANVLYFGTGLPLQGTDIILKAFSLIAAKGKNITCTFIGSTKGIPKPVVDVARLYSDIEIINWLPQEELANHIRMADLCVAGHFNKDIDKADRTIPGKAIIYEAMEKKMILGDTKANRELFAEDERHIFVQRGDAMELSRKIALCLKK